jgi:carboxylesterase
MGRVQSSIHRPAVVLLHGLCSSSLEVLMFARTLRDHGYHVATPRIAGYTVGESPHGNAANATFERWIDAVTAEIATLASSHDAVHVCGVSLGATLGLAVAAQRPPGVTSLALISTTLFFDGWNASRWRFLRPLAYYTPLARLFGHREAAPYGVKNPRVRAWIESQLAQSGLSSAGPARIPAATLREADRLIRFVKRSLPQVDVPVLLVHAREDDVASLANPRFVARRIGSRVVHQTVVEDSYHMITLDNDRDLAALKTVQFFSSVAQPRHTEPWAAPATPAPSQAAT